MPPIRVTSRRAGFIRVLLVIVVSLLAVLMGPLSRTRGSAQDVLTNESVIGMVKAGLAESVIIQKIRASQQKFDTSTDGLIKLQAAGVPDKIVEARSPEARRPLPRLRQTRRSPMSARPGPGRSSPLAGRSKRRRLRSPARARKS